MSEGPSDGCSRPGAVEQTRMRGSLMTQHTPSCTFPGCGKAHQAHGLCTGHNQQRNRGKKLAPLRATHRSDIRDEHGRKLCTTCQTWLSVDEFYPAKRSRDKLCVYCKRCDRALRIKRNYNISLEQYDEMLADQGGVCAICQGQPKGDWSFHIDHDHACCPNKMESCGQCIRGLLCEDCNRVLGMFNDKVARFEAAIDYLMER